MANWRSDATEQLCKAFLSLKTEEECYAFLEDVCTIREILDLSQRLSVAGMLRDGTSYSAISRVSKCCEYGAGGYKTVLDRMYGEEQP